MLGKLLFVLYAGAIPLVPLIGVDIYKKRGNRKKLVICSVLFAVQLLVSVFCILDYL